MGLKDHVTHKYHKTGTDASIRRLLGTHRKYLREHPSTIKHLVDHKKARPYYYDLFSYLSSLGVARKLQWVVLLISDIESPEDLTEDTSLLLIPDEVIIDEIVSLHS